MAEHVVKPRRGLNCSASGVLTRDQLLFLMLFLVDQLLAYHWEGVFLRDVKPGNIFMFRGLPLLKDFDLGLNTAVVEWAVDFDLADSLVDVCVGTSGYVLEHVAAAEGDKLTAAEVAKDPATRQNLAAADKGGLALSFLDALTGQPRSSLLSSSNSLLRGTAGCKVVPPGLVELLPEGLVGCLATLVRDGETAGDRVKAFADMREALEEAVKQRAMEEKIKVEDFLSLQHLQLKEEVGGNTAEWSGLLW